MHVFLVLFLLYFCKHNQNLYRVSAGRDLTDGINLVKQCLENRN